MAERPQKIRTLAERLRRDTPCPDEYDVPTTATAAVLVCIFEGSDGDYRVLLTKRSSSLSLHPGEVALPGGKREDDDSSYAATALREAQEEIGLDPHLVDVVAVLPPFFSKNQMKVVPVIGVLYDKEAYCPVLNRHEVESLFDVPLEMFLKNENRRSESRQWEGQNYLLHFFEHHSETEHQLIWALTAGILISVASLVFQRPPQFEEMKPPFWTNPKL